MLTFLKPRSSNFLVKSSWRHFSAKPKIKKEWARMHLLAYLASFMIGGKIVYDLDQLIEDSEKYIMGVPKDMQEDLREMKYYKDDINYRLMCDIEIEIMLRHCKIWFNGTYNIINPYMKLYPIISVLAFLLQFRYFSRRGWYSLPITTTSICFIWVISTTLLNLDKLVSYCEACDRFKNIYSELTTIKKSK
ncbi:unnamed protein product [Moneuplotes crassus]|uniref:Uncharacterized protein n=1 Tax=Euplotes crassus TaxID=5936 RepID=A0AAD2D6C5_EUPCR|nr:unnamed protein product [Moneuplotes crassus]